MLSVHCLLVERTDVACEPSPRALESKEATLCDVGDVGNMYARGSFPSSTQHKPPVTSVLRPRSSTKRSMRWLRAVRARLRVLWLWPLEHVRERVRAASALALRVLQRQRVPPPQQPSDRPGERTGQGGGAIQGCVCQSPTAAACDRVPRRPPARIDLDVRGSVFSARPRGRNAATPPHNLPDS
jgi:hypothetical protein